MRRFLLAVLATVFFSASADASPASPLGRWLTASRNLVIEITPCGRALCGHVAEVRANRSMDDNRNAIAGPPPAIGTNIITDLVPYGDEWQGKIFDPRTARPMIVLLPRRAEPAGPSLHLHQPHRPDADVDAALS